jgi:hypothetical protein
LLGINAASGIAGADANRDELGSILADCGITSNPVAQSQPSTQATSSQNYPEEE